jgi:hypothetical protein
MTMIRLVVTLSATALVATSAIAQSQAQTGSPAATPAHNTAWDQREAARKAKDARYSQEYAAHKKKEADTHAALLAKHQAHHERMEANAAKDAKPATH